MAKPKNRKQRRVPRLSPRKSRLQLGIGLILSLMVAGAALVHYADPWHGARQSAKTNDIEVTPKSLLPASPSKEYIYAGDRMVATVEPPWISPTSQSFPANGGADSISISAPPGFNWTAISNVPWVGITGGSSGSGNGVVTYSVGAHTGTASNRAGTITISGQTFTVAQGIAFLDVPPTDSYYNEIGKLSARGVTLGCGGGYYCPESNVTREQMAAFIIRALGDFNPPPPASQRFQDVPSSNIFYAFIEQMAVRQITVGCQPYPGCAGPCYCPGATVTHEQMAAFINRARGVFSPPVPSQQTFCDVLPANIFYSHIEYYANGPTIVWPGCGGSGTGTVCNGVATGCTSASRCFCPGSAVLRKEMARILVRAFNL